MHRVETRASFRVGLSWALLVSLGAPLGSLELSWASLGITWGSLELSWDSLGSLLSSLGVLLGSLGPVLGCLGALLNSLGPFLVSLGALLGSLGRKYAPRRDESVLFSKIRTASRREPLRQIVTAAARPRLGHLWGLF